MRYLLLSNTIFEAILGLIMLLTPWLLLPRANEITTLVSRSFGVASLVIALLSGVMFATDDKKFLVPTLVALSTFHVGMTISQIINAVQYATPFPIAIIHGIFAVIFMVIGIRHSR